MEVGVAGRPVGDSREGMRDQYVLRKSDRELAADSDWLDEMVNTHCTENKWIEV